MRDGAMGLERRSRLARVVSTVTITPFLKEGCTLWPDYFRTRSEGHLCGHEVQSWFTTEENRLPFLTAELFAESCPSILVIIRLRVSRSSYKNP